MDKKNYYDRYSEYRTDNGTKSIPFINIKKSTSDIYVIFDKNNMRLDTLSYKYYGDANYAWLILQANPSLGPYEYSIKDKTTIRIPYPINDAILRYEDEIKNINAESEK